MKRTILLISTTALVTAIIVFAVFEIIAQSQQLEADALIVIDSDTLGEKRNILVHHPAGFDSTRAYPVLYVLDGSSQDFRMARIAEILTRSEVIPEMLIVGIPNTDRNRDLTPHYILQDTNGETYGQGDLFLRFLQNEVIPTIDEHYNTNGHRMLAGHSRAGLYAFYAYLESPGFFDAHFCFSPAFWRDDRIIVQKARDFYGTHQEDSSTFIYMTLGTEENNKMKSAYDIMTDYLDGLNREGFIQHRYISGANHGNNLYYSTPITLKKWSEHYVE